MKGKPWIAALMALLLLGSSAAAQCTYNRNYIFYQPVRWWTTVHCPQQTPDETKPNSTPKPESTPKPQSTPKPTLQPAPTPAPTQNDQGGSFISSMEQELIRQVNGDRAKYGLPALFHSSELSRAARVRAKEIVEKFSHTRPDGSSWQTVSSAARGENIAKGQQTVDKVMAAWMSSQGHRANILRTTIGSIGVAAYRKNGIMYWVQLFGR